MHRLDANEVFFWNRGDPFEVLILKPDGSGEKRVLGPAGNSRYEPVIEFEAGWWFGGAPVEGGEAGYTLMTCVVTPGFVWEGFEIGTRGALLKTYPEFLEELNKLTRITHS